jgi:antitoxin component of MazEF toxin-antitoxin module
VNGSTISALVRVPQPLFETLEMVPGANLDVSHDASLYNAASRRFSYKTSEDFRLRRLYSLI